MEGAAMKATVYDLDNGIGVCLLTDGKVLYVAEVRFNPLRVLPQSMRPIVGVSDAVISVRDQATAQDHVDRATMGLARFRTRLEEFDPDWADDADMQEWTKEAIAARDALIGLLGQLRAEKGVGW
jgi:hypothetical protein